LEPEYLDNRKFEAWIMDAVDAIAKDGFYFGSGVIASEWIQTVCAYVRELDDRHQFVRAGIGKSWNHQLNSDIRGDKIFWLQSPSSTAIEIELNRLSNSIKEILNRELYAGLDEFEGHFAIYPTRSFYKKHIDAFKDDDRRMITLIIYLNDGWLPEHGGQLRVYGVDGGYDDYLPEAGNVVMFKSRDFPHEVLASTRERLTFTGWFKVRPGQRL
jgi:SM-20-related protein